MRRQEYSCLPYWGQLLQESCCILFFSLSHGRGNKIKYIYLSTRCTYKAQKMALSMGIITHTNAFLGGAFGMQIKKNGGIYDNSCFNSCI